MPFTEIGKAAQSAIYRAGTFGRRPKVPTDGTALEEAARKVMSRRGFAYVAGSAGARRPPPRTGRPSTGGGSCPGCCVDNSERDLGVDLFGRRHASPLLVAPSACLGEAHDDADLAVARPAPEGASRDPQHAGVGADGGGRRWLGGASRWYQLYWSRDDDLVASLVRRAEACGSEAIVVTLDTAYLGWRPRDLDLGHLPFARGEGIAQYTSDPVVPPARRGAGGRRRRRPARAAAATDPRGRAHPGVPEPATTPATPAATCGRRAAGRGRDLPRRVLQALAQLGRPAPPARADHPARRAQGGAAPRRRAPRGRGGGRRHPRVQPRRAAGRPVGGGPRRAARRRRCRASPGRTCRWSSTAASVGGRRVRGARPGRGCRGHRPPARLRARAGRRRGGREVLRNIRAELDLTMALTGCRTLADVTRDRLVEVPPPTDPTTFSPDAGTFTFAPLPKWCEGEGSRTGREAGTGQALATRPSDPGGQAGVLRQDANGVAERPRGPQHQVTRELVAAVLVGLRRGRAAATRRRAARHRGGWCGRARPAPRRRPG